MISKQLAIASLGYIIMFLWYIGYKISCLSLIIPFFISIILFLNTYILLKEKKLCISNCYFDKSSFFYRILNKQFITIMISIISAIILGFSLSIAIISFNIIDFIVFGLDLFLLVYLYNYFDNINILNEKIKYPILKNTVSWINSIVISILFIFIGIIQKPPSYLSNDWNVTVQKASMETASKCVYIDYPARISSEIAATKWQMMLNVTKQENNKYLNDILWVLFLIGNYLSIFAFSRFITEILYIFTKNFDNGEIKDDRKE